jgi:VWFA-related protein
MWTGLAVAVATCCGAFVYAAGGQAPGAAQDQPPPRFSSRTTFVEVDVIVRDKSRRFVADLRAEDFEVLDEGTPQKVTAVYRVVGPGDEPSAVGLRDAPPLPAPPREQVQRVMVLYFDQAHIQPGSFDRAKKAALTLIKDNFREGDVGGVLNGSTMVNKRLTNNRAELEAAISGLTAAPESSQILAELRQYPRFVDMTEAVHVMRGDPGFNPGPKAINDVIARACRDRPDGCQDAEQEAENKASQLVTQARMIARQTLDTVAALVNGMSRLPGRKTVIMMTEGFFTDDSWGDVRAVVGRAARANVRLYALDTRGLNRGTASSDIISAANPQASEMSMMSLGDTYSDGPNSLAVDTGGYVIRNENDFGKALNEFERDSSSYYVLGFQTSVPPDGRFHTLKVNVKRGGVDVRARKGYLASTLAAGATPGGADALSAPGVTAAAPARPMPVSPVAPLFPPEPTAVSRPPEGSEAGATTPVARARPRSAEEIESLGSSTISPRSSSSLPSDVARKASSGWDAYARGDVAAAKAALTEVAARPDAPPWVVYVLGWSHLALGDAASAVSAWEKVRGAVPQFEPVYFDLADAYQRMGELNKALAGLREAEKRWPKDVDVYNAIGVLQLARGAVDDAIATFEKGVDVDANDANACYNLAKTLEVRLVRDARAGKVAPGSVTKSGSMQDRSKAMTLYSRVIGLGGPLVDAAREGLKRLGAQ